LILDQFYFYNKAFERELKDLLACSEGTRGGDNGGVVLAVGTQYQCVIITVLS
jgi:hypothetical protein